MIELASLCLRAGRMSIGPIDLRVETGNQALLVGPTGAGKTSLIEAIAGLRTVASGRIRLADIDVTHHRPADRALGYVPQDAALFQAKSVAENLAFGLRIRSVAKVEIQLRVRDLADELGVGHLLDRRPRNLSGGERQRVALGRAIIWRPRVLLLDEPFASLDPETRLAMQSMMDRYRRATDCTIIQISHHAQTDSVKVDHVGTDHVGSDHAGSDHAGSDHVGSDHVVRIENGRIVDA